MPLRVGSRIFAPSWVATALALAVAVAFVGLGRWQWQRGNVRAAQWQQFAQATDSATPLGARGLADVPRFQRVAVSGELDPLHQFLLDNQVRNGNVGYEVLTPLELLDGRTVIVNRGWIASTGYRDRLPDISFAADGAQAFTARVDELPSAGLAAGRAEPQPGAWPKVTSFPDTAQLSAALGRRIEPRVLLLDSDAPFGYLREWQPPGLAPMRHWSYAIQWWAFAVAVVVLWSVMALKKDESTT